LQVNSPKKKRKEAGRRRLAAAFVAFLMVIAVLIYILLPGGPGFPFLTGTGGTGGTTGGTGETLHVTVHPSTLNRLDYLTYLGVRPPSLIFTAQPVGAPPFTYYWDFGDGTNSTAVAPTHTFGTNCVYSISVTATDNNNDVTHANVELLAFISKGTAGMMVVCPVQGTAGFTQVLLGGGFYQNGQRIQVVSDGADLSKVNADNRGTWSLNLTGSFEPRVNGSLYVFSTLPASAIRTFLTLEGIRASPNSGEPGDTVILEGRSYPADTNVAIFLGGVSVGSADTDANGTFSATLQVPDTPPLNQAGKYYFATSPPVLGAGATFTTLRNTATAPVAGIPWWLLAALLVLPLLRFLVALRRRKKKCRCGRLLILRDNIVFCPECMKQPSECLCEHK